MKKLVALFLTIVALFGLNSCLTEYDPAQDNIIVKPTVIIRPYYRYYDYRPYYYHRPYYHRHHRHF